MDTMARGMLPEHNLNTAYRPVAIYYDASDSIEYVREDVTCLYERVDEMLTLVLRMSDDEIIGFRLKGFRHIYEKDLKVNQDLLGHDFVMAVSAIEKMVGRYCDKIFDNYDEMRKKAYQKAWNIANENQVKISDLPKAA